jgi:endonuclease YncB( thermonuclease family)/methylphosphotriester-DNA--protein-cysteine methyltransferase
MKFSIRIASLLLFVLASLGLGLAQQPTTQTSNGNKVQLVIEGKVVRVSDGDTVTVLDKDNKQYKIRLAGIDAPESKQDYGQVSKDNLAKLVFGKQVTVLWDKVDKYRRTVGKILVDGRDINIEQVKGGFAWHYKKYESEQPPEDRVTYAEAERQARAAKLGLWQDPNPTPPGEWRQTVKLERAGPPPPEGSMVGNKNSKVYHRPDCPGYREVSEKNRVVFQSVLEAENAGYRAAKNCPPAGSTPVVTTSKAATSSTASPATTTTTTTTTAKGTPVAAQTTQTAQTAQTTPMAPTTQEGNTNTSATGPIIGNKNSKIYHRPDCPGYNKVSEKNQVKFQTVAEAEAAGYRVAKNCPAPKTP